MLEPKRRVGSWLPQDVLGQGGNATVWRARHEMDGSLVALKILDRARPADESYLRFVREVRFLTENSSLPGVLPIIGSYLPEQPSRNDRPWVAMPIATPIEVALKDKLLTEVVEAVARIASTLTTLQRELDVAHRDIKPGNLYELNGDYLIGDFGLIHLPDEHGLTGDGRQVGPRHFTAYEMIMDPTSADPHLADVYSLGKTLWVLATGQRFPPEGHQPVAMRGFEIGDYRPHPHAGVLDRLVDATTRLRPSERPTKEQVERDLHGWPELGQGKVLVDLSAARQRLRESLRHEFDAEEEKERMIGQASMAAGAIEDKTLSIHEELLSFFPAAQVSLGYDKMTENLVRGRYFGRRVIWDWRRCTLVGPLPGRAGERRALRMSRVLELLDDGHLHVHLMIHVGREGLMGADYHWVPSEELSARVGSIEADLMLERAVEMLAKEVGPAVDALVNAISGSGG